MEDLYARIVRDSIPNIVGPYGENVYNENGKMLRDLQKTEILEKKTYSKKHGHMYIIDS